MNKRDWALFRLDKLFESSECIIFCDFTSANLSKLTKVAEFGGLSRRDMFVCRSAFLNKWLSLKRCSLEVFGGCIVAYKLKYGNIALLGKLSEAHLSLLFISYNSYFFNVSGLLSLKILTHLFMYGCLRKIMLGQLLSVFKILKFKVIGIQI